MRLCSLKHDAGGFGKEFKGQESYAMWSPGHALVTCTNTQQLCWLPDQVQARHSSGEERGGDVTPPLTEEPLTVTEKETHLSLG